MSSERHPQWHQRFDACQGCGRDDRPHIAKGLCERCYRKARLAERHQGPEPAPVAESAPGKRGWHQAYAACEVCGKATRPHHHGGVCVDCYRARNRLGDRGRETLPIYQGQRAIPTPITSRQGLATTGVVVSRGPATISAANPSCDTPELAPGLSAMASPDTTAAPPARLAARSMAQGDAENESGEGRGPEGDVAGAVLLAAPRPPAPRLYPRHITVIRTYVITCPNCGETAVNERTRQGAFSAEDLPPGVEVTCQNCGARWGITIG
jgi:hypothetical protein